MHDFKEHEAESILRWFEPIISTISVNLEFLKESFADKNIETNQVEALINMIENIEYLDEFDDFYKHFAKFKSSMSMIINKLFKEQADTNLYEIYSHLYIIDNILNTIEEWLEISTKRSIDNDVSLDRAEIKEYILKRSQEDLNEFAKIAAEFQLLGKDEQKLFNVISFDDDWEDVEEGMNIFIDLYEISHPLSFLTKTSREMQNIETTSYYLLIRILALVSFYNYWVENLDVEDLENANFKDEEMDELVIKRNPELDDDLFATVKPDLEVQVEDLPDFLDPTLNEPIKRIKVVDNVSELVNDLEKIRDERFKK